MNFLSRLLRRSEAPAQSSSTSESPEPRHITRFRRNIETADLLAGKDLHENPQISKMLRPTGTSRRRLVALHKALMAAPHGGRRYTLGEMRAAVREYDMRTARSESSPDRPEVSGFIYRIQVAGRSYVGQTHRNVTDRWREHERDAFERGSILPVHQAMRAAGREDISFHTLEVVHAPMVLDVREQHWMDHFDAELNGRQQLGSSQSKSHLRKNRRVYDNRGSTTGPS